MSLRRALAPIAAALPVLVFAIIPIALLVLRAVVAAEEALFDELLSPAGLAAVRHSIATSAGAAAFALAIGTPLAILLHRTDLPGRTQLAALFTLPTAIPPFIWGMGWVTLASPRAGYMNRAFDAELLNIYGAPGIAFVLGTAGMPLVLLAGQAALARIDSSLEEAARISGATPLRAVLTATLPLALPSLLAGAGLVFLFAASAFGVPYLLGASASPPTTTLTVRIVQLLQGGGMSGAMGLAAALLVLATVVLGVNQWLGRFGRVRLASGKGVSIRPIALGRWRPILAGTAWSVAIILVVLPLLAIALTSFQRTFGAALTDLTLAHWQQTFSDARTLHAAGWSLSLALGAGVVVALLGLAISLVRHHGGRAGRAIETLSVWPYAVPGTVLALALIVAFSRDVRLVLFDRLAFVLALGDTAWLLLVAYAAKHLAFGTRYTGESLAQVDPSLAESARIYGATPARAFRDATLPLLRPALATAFLLTFLTCTTELTMSVLLVPPERELLGTRLFNLMTYADPTGAAVLACAFVGLVGVSLVGLSTLRKGRQP